MNAKFCSPIETLIAMWTCSIAKVTVLSLFLICFTNSTLAETVRIGGTGAALGTIHQLGAAFHKEHPAFRITVLPSLGTSGGLKALQGGALDIAVTARDLNVEEKNLGMSAFMYGTTAFIFVSHPKVTPMSLTKASLASLYSGKQTQWTNGKPVRLILRPKGDTDTKQLNKLSPEIEAAVAAAHAKAGMIIAITDTDAADNLEKIPGAFGTSTLALLLSEKRNLNVFSIDGITPNTETLRNGSYPHTKDMYLVTMPTPSEGARLFINFIHSAKATEILKKTGHRVPASP